MKKIRNLLGLLHWPMIIGCLFLILLVHDTAQAGTLDDNTPPDISITSPAPGGTSYITTKAVIDLAGTASDNSAIKEITWENNQGGAGFATATTDWITPWNWQAASIPLQPGANIITITAKDVVIPANENTDFLVVTYNPGPPPSVLKTIDPKISKVKMDIYKNKPGNDHVSVVTYLKKGSTEPFVMPMNVDVTVILKVPDPNNPAVLIPIYSETIPAGTVPGTYTNYRYTSGPPGIRELSFQKASTTSIYCYVYVENVDFLPGIRAIFLADLINFPANYTTWLLGITSLNFTVQTGSIAWTGNIPLPKYPDENLGSRVEYIYNR